MNPYYRRSPRQVGVALDRMQAALAPETLLAEVQAAWDGVVGASISGNASPVAERGGTLTVSCAAAVWAHELDLIAPEIVERLNAGLRSGRINRLRCVATPPRGS